MSREQGPREAGMRPAANATGCRQLAVKHHNVLKEAAVA